MGLKHQLKGVWCDIEKKLTWDELKEVITEANGKDIIKAQPVNIPKDDKYDRITIAKRRTRERLGIWVD
ncbi:MAG: hypothetical protein JG777_2536 [Clostridia bacterium]|jgi:hypothetical protein|nr:hypothetical protein [Clostridia bacterium]